LREEELLRSCTGEYVNSRELIRFREETSLADERRHAGALMGFPLIAVSRRVDASNASLVVISCAPNENGGIRRGGGKAAAAAAASGKSRAAISGAARQRNHGRPRLPAKRTNPGNIRLPRSGDRSPVHAAGSLAEERAGDHSRARVQRNNFGKVSLETSRQKNARRGLAITIGKQ